jgi:predicted ester cyclase
MSDQRKAAARRMLETAWNEGDFSVYDEVFSDGYVGHTPFGDLRGPEPVKHVVSQFRSAMTGIRMTVEEQISEGDSVATRWSLQATQTGPLLGVEPTGRDINVTGVLVLHFDGDQATEGWQLWDRLAVLEQLGAAPEPATVASR